MSKVIIGTHVRVFADVNRWREGEAQHIQGLTGKVVRKHWRVPDLWAVEWNKPIETWVPGVLPANSHWVMEHEMRVLPANAYPEVAEAEIEEPGQSGDRR